MKSEILNVIHEAATELTDAEIMKVTTMRELDVLCLPVVENFSAQHIKSLREKEHVSQAVFAAYLNTSASTVKQWEQGGKKPRGTSLKLLNLVAHKGLSGLCY